MESRLRTEDLQNCQRIERDVPSYRCEVTGGGKVLVKLASDHTGEMVRREVAAWHVAKHLGWLSLVPVTVLREFRSFAAKQISTEGSVQAFIAEAIDRPDPWSFSEEDRWKGAVFDALVKPADRGTKEGGGNWLGLRDTFGNLRLILIDHEHSFAGGLRLSVFYKLLHAQSIPRHILESLERLRSGLAAGDEVGMLIGRVPAGRLQERLNHLLEKAVVDVSPLD